MNNERVILIQGDHTKWYEQAIFIVKQKGNHNRVPTDLVAEAEKIIHSYQNGFIPAFNHPARPVAALPKRTVQKKSGFNKWLNVIMCLSCILLAAVIVVTFQ